MSAAAAAGTLAARDYLLDWSAMGLQDVPRWAQHRWASPATRSAKAIEESAP